MIQVQPIAIQISKFLFQVNENYCKEKIKKNQIPQKYST